MKKLVTLAALVVGAKSVLDRRKRAADANSALWREAVQQPGSN
jgi:hypothetical protein